MNLKKSFLLGFAVLTGLAGIFSFTVALANVPDTQIPAMTQVTDDTKMYENLSEIRVKKTGRLDFDDSIDRLADLESRYHEGLPKSGDKSGSTARAARPKRKLSVRPYASAPQPTRLVALKKRR